MELLLQLSASKLTDGDGIIALLIVGFVEYIIKDLICIKIFKKEPSKALMKIAPVATGGFFYLILSFIQKEVWYTALLHGLSIGLLSMGSYDLLLKKLIEIVNTAIEFVKIALTEGWKKAVEFIKEKDKEAREILEDNSK